jgi:hypothetical protein
MTPATRPEPASPPAVLTGWARIHAGSLERGALAASVYAAMVLIMWGAYNVFSGFPYETFFPYFSETHPGIAGLYYAADLLRVYENHFYHLGFVLSEILGVRGSYVPYQIVYASLWWARGLLVFLLIRRFLPDRALIAYVAGGLVLVHSADGALQWVGQMNQFGFIFWMLSAFLALTLALETRWYFSIPLVVLAAILEHRSLWSYESQILLILLFPLLLILHPRRTWRKLLPLAAVWYTVPAQYIRLTVERYASSQHTYQQSVARKVWSTASIVSDWWFNASFSLEFWKWSRSQLLAARGPEIWLSLALTAVFLCGGIATARLWPGPQDGMAGADRRGRDWKTLSWFLACGLGVLLLSFPVYLVLDVARNLWRTQMLSGMGAGMVLTALAALAASMVPRPRWRAAVFLCLAAVVAFFGSVSAIQKGAFHRAIWEKHRAAVREILEAAPSVKPNTVVVLTDIPKEGGRDPFGDGMWYDMTLRLAYIDTDVSGIYLYSDGSRPTGDNLVLHGDRWTWNGLANQPLVKNATVAQTVVVRYVPGGKGQLETSFPQALCGPDCSAAGEYRPENMIAGPIAPRTVRRYNLEPGFPNAPSPHD